MLHFEHLNFSFRMIKVTLRNAHQELAKKSIWQKHDPVHGARGANREILTVDFLKKYIYYAKNRYNPVLTDEAINTISDGYAQLRNERDSDSLPVTARTLETLIRLSSAHAKARLSRNVEEKDAEKAMELLRFAIYHDTKPQAAEPQEEDAPEESSPSRKRARDEESEESPYVTDVESSFDVCRRDVILQLISAHSEDELELQVLLDLLKKTKPSIRISKDNVVKELYHLEENNLIMFDRANKTIIKV